MFSNLHFATATHIIALLMLERDTWLSSDYIAGSININPVVVRKEIRKLKEAQLVISKEGKNGGVRIAEDINKKHLRMFIKQHWHQMKRVNTTIRIPIVRWEKTSTTILQSYITILKNNTLPI